MPMKRLPEIDFLRGVLIILVVVFHLVYIADTYPYLKKVIYAFHVPGFFVISGYLLNVDKDARSFFKSILYLLIPYLFVEPPYAIATYVFNIREGMQELTLQAVLQKVFLKPLGLCWYLHTLIICSSLYYGLHRLFKHLSKGKDHRLLLFMSFGILMWILDSRLHLILIGNAVFFIGGAVLRSAKIDFNALFRPSLWAIIPVIILSLYPNNLERNTLGAILITFLMLCFFIGARNLLPVGIQKSLEYLGRNTLPVFFFSPIFTLAARMYLSFLLFDTTGIIFAVVTTLFTIAGCFAIAWCMDKLGISKWFFLKEKILVA